MCFLKTMLFERPGYIPFSLLMMENIDLGRRLNEKARA